MRPAGPLLALSLALALSACGRSQDATPNPEPPADAPPAPAADFTRPLNALGDEPFWALKIRPDSLVFSAAGQADARTANPGPKTGTGAATWTGVLADGRTLAATLTAAPCRGGGPGQAYPFTAEVRLGDAVLKGCAAYAEAAATP